jgi:hypothetical protein
MEKQDKKNKNTQVKRFSYTFTPVMLVLIIGVLLLCSAGIAVSIWRIVQFGIKSFNDVIKYPFLIAVCVFCIVFVISVFIRSQYIVSGDKLITQFGFIKSSYDIKKITALTFDRDTNKLTVNFGEEYALLAVNPEWNEQLVRAILDVNNSIDYSFTLTEIKH